MHRLMIPGDAACASVPSAVACISDDLVRGMGARVGESRDKVSERGGK